MRLAGIGHHLLHALPSPLPTAAGSIVWGCAMALSAAFALEWRIESQTSHWTMLILIYFLGGAIAWPFALYAMRVAAIRRRAEVRFAAAFLALSVGTIGFTAVIFAFVYRNFYAQWHGEFFSTLWFIQLAFTSATAIYQFAVIGLRLYLPLGLVMLFAASLWQARTMR